MKGDTNKDQNNSVIIPIKVYSPKLSKVRRIDSSNEVLPTDADSRVNDQKIKFVLCQKLPGGGVSAKQIHQIVTLRRYGTPVHSQKFICGKSQESGPGSLESNFDEHISPMIFHDIFDEIDKYHNEHFKLEHSSTLEESAIVNYQLVSNHGLMTGDDGETPQKNVTQTHHQEVCIDKSAATGGGGGVVSFRCPECDCVFRSRATFEEHRDLHVDDNFHACPLCPSVLRTRFRLEEHSRVHTGERPFRSREALRVHRVSHAREKRFCCHECGRRFGYASTLRAHLRRHARTRLADREKSFSCVYCDKPFAQRRFLTRHLRVHTGEKPFLCNYCAATFATNEQLKKHIRKHTGEKPHACSFCGRAFIYRTSLVSHVRTHTGERPYACAVCDASFGDRNALKAHASKSHSVGGGPSPAPSTRCHVCGKAFKSRHIAFHMRTHTGEKPFACAFCGRRFSWKANMQRHERTHTGEQPFLCDWCGAAFAQKGVLDDHLATHTGAKRFPCARCPAAFHRRVLLARHHQHRHQQQPSSQPPSLRTSLE